MGCPVMVRHQSLKLAGGLGLDLSFNLGNALDVVEMTEFFIVRVKKPVYHLDKPVLYRICR